MEAELCRQRWPPSQADIKVAWGSGGTHAASVATRQSRPQAVGAPGALHMPFRVNEEQSPLLLRITNLAWKIQTTLVKHEPLEHIKQNFI